MSVASELGKAAVVAATEAGAALVVDLLSGKSDAEILRELEHHIASYRNATRLADVAAAAKFPEFRP